MSGLTIGSLALNPAFDPAVTAYTATTSNATNKVTATATDAGATVALALNGTAVNNGDSLTWASGENTLTITVGNGSASTTYTVTVTKS